MQGIKYVEYKLLREGISKTKSELDINLVCEHSHELKKHEEKLEVIYTQYQSVLEELAVIIREFESHKRSIRRTILVHKHCKKIQVRKQLN